MNGNWSTSNANTGQQGMPQLQNLLFSALSIQQQQNRSNNYIGIMQTRTTQINNNQQYASNAVNLQTIPISQSTVTASVAPAHQYVRNQANVVVVGQTALNTPPQLFGNNQLANNSNGFIPCGNGGYSAEDQGSIRTNLLGEGNSRPQNNVVATTMVQPGTDFHQPSAQGVARRSMSLNDASVLQDHTSSQHPSSAVFSNIRTSRANVVNTQIPSAVVHHRLSSQTLPTLPRHELYVNAPVLNDFVRAQSQVLPTLNQNQSQLNTGNLQTQSQRGYPQENIRQERQSSQGSATNASGGQGIRYIRLDIPVRYNSETSRISGTNSRIMYITTSRGRFPIWMSQMTFNALKEDIRNSMRTPTASNHTGRASNASNYFGSSSSGNAGTSNFPAGMPVNVQGGTINASASNFATGPPMNVQEVTVNMSTSNFAAGAPGNVQGGTVSVYTSNFPADTSRNVQGNAGNVSTSVSPAIAHAPTSNLPSSTPVNVPVCAGNVCLLSLPKTAQSSYPANMTMNTSINTITSTTSSRNLKLTPHSLMTTAVSSTNFSTTESYAASNAQNCLPQNPNVLQQNVNASSISNPTARCHVQTSNPLSEENDSTHFKIPSTTQSTTTALHSTSASTNHSEPAISQELWEYLYSPQVTDHVIDDETESEGLPFWTCDPEKWKKERENRSRISSLQALATSASSTSNVSINGESFQTFNSQKSQSPATSMGSVSNVGISRKATQDFNQMPLASTSSTSNVSISRQPTQSLNHPMPRAVNSAGNVVTGRQPIQKFGSQMPATSPNSTSNLGICREPIQNFNGQTHQMPPSSSSSASNTHITRGVKQNFSGQTSQMPASSMSSTSDVGITEANNVSRVRSDVIVINDDSNGSNDQSENPKSEQFKNATKCDDKWVKTGHSVMETNDVIITEELFEEQSQSPGNMRNNGTTGSKTNTEKDGITSNQTAANGMINCGSAQQDTGHDQQSISSSSNHSMAQSQRSSGLQGQDSATSKLLIKLMQRYQAVLQLEQAESGVPSSPSNESYHINVGSQSRELNDSNQPVERNHNLSTLSTQNENIASDGKTKQAVDDLQDQEDDDMPHVLKVFSLENQTESEPFAPKSSDAKDGADVSCTAVEEINTHDTPSGGRNEKTCDDSKTTQSSEVDEGTRMISNSEQTKMLPANFVSKTSDPLPDTQYQEMKEESDIASYSGRIPVPHVSETLAHFDKEPLSDLYVSTAISANPLVIKIKKSKRKMKWTGNSRTIQKPGSVTESSSEKCIIKTKDQLREASKSCIANNIKSLSQDRQDFVDGLKSPSVSKTLDTRESSPFKLPVQSIDSIIPSTPSPLKTPTKLAFDGALAATPDRGEIQNTKAQELLETIHQDVKFRETVASTASGNAAAAAVEKNPISQTVQTMKSKPCSLLDAAANQTKADSSSSKPVQSSPVLTNHPSAGSENPKLSQWLSSKRSNAIVSRQVADDDFADGGDSASEICSSIIDEMLDQALAASSAKKTPDKSLSGSIVNRSTSKYEDTMEEVSGKAQNKNIIQLEESNAENENYLGQTQVVIGETIHREISKAKCINLVSKSQRTGVSSQSGIIAIPKSKGSQEVEKQEQFEDSMNLSENKIVSQSTLNRNADKPSPIVARQHRNNSSLQDGKNSLKRAEENKNIVSQHPQTQNSDIKLYSSDPKRLESSECIQNGRSSQNATDQVCEVVQSSNTVTTDNKVAPTNTSKSSSPIFDTGTIKLKIKPNLTKLHSVARNLTKPGLPHRPIQIPLAKQGLFSRFIQRSPNKSHDHDGVIHFRHKDLNVSKSCKDSEEKSSITDAMTSQNASHKRLKYPESYVTSKMNKLSSNCDENPAEKRQTSDLCCLKKDSRNDFQPSLTSNSDSMKDGSSRLQISEKAQTNDSIAEFSDISDEEMDAGQAEASKAADFHDKYSDISDDDAPATQKTNEKTINKSTNTFSGVFDDDVSTSDKRTTRISGRFSDISDEESENPEMASIPSLRDKEKSIVISTNRFSDISDEDDNMVNSESASSQKATTVPGNKFSNMSSIRKNLKSDTSGIKYAVSCDKLSNVSNGINRSKRNHTSPMLNSFKKSDLQSILSPTKKLNEKSVRKDRANSDADSDNDDKNLVIDTDDEGGNKSITSDRSFSDKENIPVSKNPPSLQRMDSIGSEESWPFLTPSSQQSQDDPLKSSSLSGASPGSFTSTCSDDNSASCASVQSGYMGKDELSSSLNNQGESAIELSPTSSEVYHPATPDQIHENSLNSTTAMTGFAMSFQKELPTTNENSENPRNIFDKMQYIGGCALSPNKETNQGRAFTSDIASSKMLSRVEISPIQLVTGSREEGMEASKTLSTHQVQSMNRKSGSAKNLFATVPDNLESTGDMSSSRAQNDTPVHSSASEALCDGTDESLTDRDNSKSIDRDIKPDINALSQAASVPKTSGGEMVLPFPIKKEREELNPAENTEDKLAASTTEDASSNVRGNEDLMVETDPNCAGSETGDTDGETNNEIDEEVSTPSSRMKSLFNQLLASGRSATSKNSQSESRTASTENISTETNEQPASSGQNNEKDVGVSTETSQESSTMNPSLTSDSKPATTEDPEENSVTPSVFPSFSLTRLLQNDSLISARVKMEKVQRSFSTSDVDTNRSLSEADDALLASSDSESDSTSVSGYCATLTDDVTKKIGNSTLDSQLEEMKESLETSKPTFTIKSERITFDSDDELLASSDSCSERHPSPTAMDDVTSATSSSITHLGMKNTEKNADTEERSQNMSTSRLEKSTLLNLFKTGTEMTSSDSNLNSSSTDREISNPKVSHNKKESLIHTSDSVDEISSCTSTDVKNAHPFSATSRNQQLNKVATNINIPEDVNQLRKTTSADVGEGMSNRKASNSPSRTSISSNEKESNLPVSDIISSPINSDAVSETSDIPSDVDTLVIIDDDCDATNNLQSVHSDVINVCSPDDNPMKSNNGICVPGNKGIETSQPVTTMSTSPNLSPVTRSNLEPEVISSPIKPRRRRKSRPVSVSSSDEDFSTQASTSISQDRSKTSTFSEKANSLLPSMSSSDKDSSTPRTSSDTNKRMKKSIHRPKSPVISKNKNPHLLSLSSSNNDSSQSSTSAGHSRSTPASFKRKGTKIKQDRNGNAMSSKAQNSSDEEVDVVTVDDPETNPAYSEQLNRNLKRKQNVTSLHTKSPRTISGDKKANYKRILKEITGRNARSRSNSLNRIKQRKHSSDSSGEAPGGDREPSPQEKRQHSSDLMKRKDDSSDSSDGDKAVPAKHKNPYILMDYSGEEDNENYDEIVISVKHRDQDSDNNSPKKDIIYDARKVDYVQLNSDSDNSSESSALDLMDPDVYESDSQPSSDGTDHETQKSKNASRDIPEMSLRGGNAFDESSPNRFHYSVIEAVERVSDAEPDQPSTSYSQERSTQKRKKLHNTISTPVSKKVSKRGTPKLPRSFVGVRKTPLASIAKCIEKKYANAEFDEESEESSNDESRKRKDHRGSDDDSESDVEPMPKRRRGLGNGLRHRNHSHSKASENARRRNRNDTTHRKENKTRRRLPKDGKRTSKSTVPLPPICLRGSIRTATGRHSWYTRDKVHLKNCSVVLKRLHL